MAIPAQMHRYQWVQNNGKGYIVLPGLNNPAAFHFFGTRLLVDIVKTGVEVGAESSVRTRQVHGDQVCRVTDETLEQQRFSGDALTGDALITDRSHVLITVSTADCVPVLLLDPIRKAVAAIHAGWRGTVLNISAKVVREMGLHYGSEPGDLMAGIGPSIGPCCYEVGNNVWQQVERKYVYGHEAVLHQQAGKAILDLARLNHRQLMEVGLRPERISFSGLCTACFPNLFYSFRRDKMKTGNMMSGIMLTSGFHGEFRGC